MMDGHSDPGTGIAIVGMAGRLPGAPDLARFWENLRSGVESITFFTDEELAAAGVSRALLADPLYVKARAVLDGADLFDPAFFGFTPREGELLDPQHRLFLEASHQALEDAGYDPDRFPGRIGVYGGCGSGAYMVFNILPNAELMARVGGLQAVLLNEGDFFTTRASYKLNLRGPSTLVQTACSTALVAVHMACQSLLSGETDMALAGGSQVDVPQRVGYLYQESGVMSRDGHCRSFDADASGTVNGSGVGVVLLKRLGDALAAGDRIHAVIRGSAINNDGSSKVGFTAPSVSGQAEVIAESLLMAGVEPDSIGYVEAHGSATPLGDPVEVAALTQAFREGTERVGYCALGSVKSNIGHCNAAAGIAGLLKATLTVAHGEIPPSLHCASPNPQIDFAGSPFFVNTALRPWPAELAPRRAGVSSFGLGGTNAHVVLEEAPAVEPSEPPRRAAQLFLVSARTPEALEAAGENLAAWFESRPDLDPADAAWTLQVGRRAFEHRRAVVAESLAEAAASLRDPARRIDLGRPAVALGVEEPPLVFLFPGLGDQHLDMARGLYEIEPVFRAELDRCAGLLEPELGEDLRTLLFSPGDGWREKAKGAGVDLKAFLRRGTEAGETDPAAARLARTEIAQPVHFAVEYALGRLLFSWGLEPEAMMGYSVGEYTAACLAGVLALPDAARLVARRARLIAGLPEGAMLAVPLAQEEVAPLLPAIDPQLSVSAVNGPYFTVVGGPRAAVDELARRLKEEKNAACLPLATTHAFHSAMMEPAMAELTALARGIAVGRPEIPYISNVTGTWIAEDDLADPEYWARHMRQTVRFSAGLQVLLERPERAFVEVGPGGTLATLVRQHPAAPASVLTLQALRHQSDDRGDSEHLLGMLGRLWAAGGKVDWEAFQAGARRLRVELPTYPFERRRCWIDPPDPSRANPESLEGVIGEPRPAVAARAELSDWFYAPALAEAPAVGRAGDLSGSWLLLSDASDLASELAGRLEAAGGPVHVAPAGATRADYDQAVAALPADTEPPVRVLYLGALGEVFPAEPTGGLAGLLLLCQALAQAGKTATVAAVATGAVAVADDEPLAPARAGLAPAAKVLHQEFPQIAVKVVDVLPTADLAERLFAEALSPVPADSPLVALRGRRRYVRRYAPLPLAPDLTAAAPLPHGGRYVVTAGPSAAGAALARFLTTELGGRVAAVVAEGAAAVPEAEVSLSFPPADPAALGRAVAEACERLGGAVDGVFHAALPTAGGLIQLKAGEALPAMALPLAQAEAVLAAVAGPPSPFVLLWGSTLTVTGGLGQLDGALSGAFFEALAERETRAGRAVFAIDWDPYQWDAWLAAGAGGLVPGLSAEESAADLAANAVPAAESGEALRRLLGAGLPRAVVTPHEIRRMIADTDAFTAQSLLGALGKKDGKAQPRTLATPYVAPESELEKTLAGIWEELFGLEQVGVDDDFLELGGHSLLAIQMATQIRNATGIDLQVSTLFEASTVGKLAAALEALQPQEDPEELERLLAEIEGLAPDEALARMAALQGETPP